MKQAGRNERAAKLSEIAERMADLLAEARTIIRGTGSDTERKAGRVLDEIDCAVDRAHGVSLAHIVELLYDFDRSGETEDDPDGQETL